MINYKNKYNAKKTSTDGWTFDSKAEAKRYQELKLLQASGDIEYFLCQVPFRLPGKIIYRVDFMYVEILSKIRLSQRVIYEDVKGVITDVSRIKIKQVQEIYRITINLITKKGIQHI